MPSNLLTLGLPSLIQLSILIWHMIKYRGKNTALWFLGAGLAFGFLRSQIIHYIQININNSVVPYQFADNALKIGNDSLQVYLGWITTAYLAWCFAEIIIKNLKRNGFFANTTEPEREIFPILGFGFLFISTFSYLIEATASVMDWWHWNQYLESGFAQSLFANVPWVGIVDWSTVAFEFLGTFLITRYSLKSKKYRYLLIWALPLVHWLSHVNAINFEINLLGGGIFLGTIMHYILPLIAFCFIFIRGPRILKTAENYKAVWIGAFITYGVCLVSLLTHQEFELMVSLIPITLFFIAATLSTEKIITLGSLAILVTALVPLSSTLKQRLGLSFYVLAVIAAIKIVEAVNTKIFVKKIKISSQTIIALIGILILIMIVAGGSDNNKNDNLAEPTPSQPNVIIISFDNLRLDRVGALNSESALTPNITKFAKQTDSYANAYTPVPYTLPAHFSFFTGAYPNTSGIGYNAQTSLTAGFEPITMAEIFRDNGYQTAAFLGSAILDKPLIYRGFDILDNNFTFDPSLEPATESNPRVAQRDAATVNEAFTGWLGDKDKLLPFFSFVHYFDIHAPYTPNCPFDNSALISPDHRELLGANISKINEKNLKFTANDYRYLEYLYDQEVRCTDAAFGELLDYLKKAEIYDNSYIIVISDHGENFDHNKVFHGENVYEGAVKVPLFIKAPNQEEGRALTNKVSLIDVYPTLFNTLNFRIDHKVDGQALDNKERLIYLETTPAAAAATPPRADKIFAIIDGGQKLIRNNAEFIEGYNLEEDPNESINTYSNNDTLHETLLLKINRFFRP